MDLLREFQSLMTSYDFDAFIVPTSDYHNSEYISAFFKGRQALTGFTGSAGTLLVTRSNAYLWVDGRYFIQAEKEVNNNIEIMKMGNPNVPTIEEFLIDFFRDIKRKTLGCDGKVVSSSFILNLKEKLGEEILIRTDMDLVNEVWTDRPPLPFSVLYQLDKAFSGVPFQNKLALVRDEMKKNNADIHILTQLEDQAWLYNLRANDVLHTPVFLAYTIITKNQVLLFIDDKKIDLNVEKFLNENDIIVREYDDIYDYIISTISDKRVLVDLNILNYQLYSNLEYKNDIINKENPTLLLKSIKNDVEIENIKDAHIKDGVAMVKFMHYLKKAYLNGDKMDEISLSDKLKKFREANKGLIDLSFNTICGFKDHAAMMHYSATKESSYSIEGNGFLLVDSGGHYLEGTTDITRTFALGKITDKMKVDFTNVLKGVINLASAVFLDGCTGQNLDVLARAPMWKEYIDYKCGTGHGVGYVLSVHEGPNSFRWQRPSAILKPGMITTDEPGIYIEGKYGIRIENELLCVPAKTNEWGTFHKFETITYCPIDIDAIKPQLLTKYEKEWLNEYHAMVFEKLSPKLKGEELEFLKEYTKKI